MSPNRLFELAVLQQIIERQADILGDLAQQDRGEVAADMQRHGGRAAIEVAELLVRKDRNFNATF